MPIQKSKVTIFDVAKASGVSSSAVSYALNGKSGVSDVTRDKVLKVAHDLGWKPNGAAQALAKAKTQRVGLVLGYGPEAAFRRILHDGTYFRSWRRAGKIRLFSAGTHGRG